MDTQDFKKVIDGMIDERINKKGITKYISAIIDKNNFDGTYDVYIPPDNDKVITSLVNKTGEELFAGDSVELCSKNGKTNNAWISLKHGISRPSIEGGSAFGAYWTKLNNRTILYGQKVKMENVEFTSWGSLFKAEVDLGYGAYSFVDPKISIMPDLNYGDPVLVGGIKGTEGSKLGIVELYSPIDLGNQNSIVLNIFVYALL